jgi:hypothetical protein
MQNDEDMGFDQAICRILIAPESQSLEQLLERLRVLEAGELSRNGTDAVSALETKRSVANARIHVSISRRVPFEVCRQYFDELCNLGFPNTLVEFVTCRTVARYALQCGCPSRGALLIEPFIEEWHATGKRPSRCSNRFMKEAARLLHELQKK